MLRLFQVVHAVYSWVVSLAKQGFYMLANFSAMVVGGAAGAAKSIWPPLWRAIKDWLASLIHEANGLLGDWLGSDFTKKSDQVFYQLDQLKTYFQYVNHYLAVDYVCGEILTAFALICTIRLIRWALAFIPGMALGG